MSQISVVINTYNSSRFILDTIESVLKQSFKDFELIIIDDGSTDDTLEVLAGCDDARIKVYPYPNGGISKSRNRGLAHASGEFIAFLDHDDLWNEKKLEQQLSALKSNPKAAFAYSWVEAISESGDFIRFYPRTCQNGDVYRAILSQSFVHTASNPLLRRQLVVSIGGFDEDIYGADEWDLLIRLAKNHEAALSPYFHVRYRIVEGSGSANVAKVEKGALRVIEKNFRSTPKELQSLKAIALGKVYQHLCFRTLEEMEGSHSGLAAWRYLLLSRQQNPRLWGTTPMAKAMFKISAAILLPRGLARGLTKWATSTSRALEKD